MYGTPTGVAALAKQWTDNGVFVDDDCLYCLHDEATNPTLTEVTNWLIQLSSTVDVALAGEGFVVPVTATNPVNAIRMVVEQLCADLVQAANGSGRFFTEKAVQAGTVPMMVIRKEILAWANENAVGLEAAGATRQTSSADTIGTKANTPIFARNSFGNKFEEWPDNSDDQ